MPAASLSILTSQDTNIRGSHRAKNFQDHRQRKRLRRRGASAHRPDLATPHLYSLGHNAPEPALLKEGHTAGESWAAYQTMTDALRPWTIDFHVAQNDGSVHGTGSHDKTGRHCQANDPNGKLDIARCATYWLKDHAARGIKHICWDGCMFPNDVLEQAQTWNHVLQAMINVDDAI